ncbi:MAG: phosphatase PAP2 family protein [Candidatus Aminicenantes bacterium]|nr:phosphatase PAP2 family protein [Candidatus Aminicenantes bacterium]
MENVRRVPFLRSLRALDLVLALVLLVGASLAAAFRTRVPPGPPLVPIGLATAVLFLGLNRVQQRQAHPGGRFFLRLLSVSIALLVIYETWVRLSLIAWPAWQDPALISMEQRIFGTTPTVWLQALVSPALTEWLMFAYVVYFALYPVVTAVLFFRHGEPVLEAFLFTLAFNNIFCNLFYPLFPVDNPVAGLGALHAVPLQGWFFTAAGEYMRSTMTPGGGMPSGHVAATTIMLLAVYKYERRLFYPLLSVGLSLIAATVYGRFHYLSDSLMGLAAALFCWWAAPIAKRCLDRILASRGRTCPLPDRPR